MNLELARKGHQINGNKAMKSIFVQSSGWFVRRAMFLHRRYFTIKWEVTKVMSKGEHRYREWYAVMRLYIATLLFSY